MKLCQEPDTLPFRKDTFEVVYHYYLCEDTNERFTTDELDELNTVQVYNQYREKYGIPFPEGIKSIREKYGVSAQKMSEILGFGTNTYRLYEAGEMPSVSNGRLILSVNDPEEFCRQVKASAHILSEKESEKFLNLANRKRKEEQENQWDILFTKQIFGDLSPNKFNGYRTPDLARISQVIAYFSLHGIDLYKTKLNKLLFYVDFNCFQALGYSLTGITYKAIQYGPVPVQFEKLFVKLSDDEKITRQEIEVAPDQYGDKIVSNEPFDEMFFTDIEKEILAFVVAKFKNLSSSNLVEVSHREDAWIRNQEQRQIISYPKFAFSLREDNSFLYNQLVK